MCVHSHTTFALSLCAKCCLHLLLLRLLEAYDRLLPVGPTVGTPAVVITNCLLQHFMLSVSLPRQAFTLRQVCLWRALPVSFARLFYLPFGLRDGRCAEVLFVPFVLRGGRCAHGRDLGGRRDQRA